MERHFIEKITTKLLYLFTILFIGAFPFGDTPFKVFRGLSVSSLHYFEKTAPFKVSLPPLFNKYIHFHLTDFWIVGLLIAALYLKEVKLKELFWNRHSRYLTFYFCIALLSILFSIFQTYFLQYITLVNLTIAFISFHLIYSLLSKQKEWIPKALWFFIIIAACECFIGMGQFLFQKSLGLSFLSEAQINPSMENIAVYPLTKGNRAFFDLLPWIRKDHFHILRAHGTFDHPNIFGGYLVIALFVAYFLFIESNNRLKKGLLLILIPLLILTLILTFSRGPFFAWILGTFLFFGVGWMKRMKGFITLGSLIGGGLFISLLLLLPQLIARGGFVNYNGLSGASDSGRILYYKLAGTLFLSHPFLGIGYNCFALQPSISSMNPVGALAHNIYLQIASETGIFGLALFGLFLFSLILPIFREKLTPLFLTLLTILFSLLLMGLVDHFLWAYNAGRLMFFIFSALLAAYYRKARECPSRSQAK